ncbi:MAG TPA: serine/threonine-protein kinase [Polyangiaceae bacterium]|nr:serine/threonine-protein kinase [Polyangiaceae bacterium]
MSEPSSSSKALPTRPGSLSGESPSGPLTLANTRQCPVCNGRYPADFKVCPRDATPLEDALPDDGDPVVGQLLSGTYEVLRVIGEGGMGRVYEARHARLPNKRFAIKMLHQELARQPEVVTRFQREAEAASGLSHPNVISVFDVNTAPDGRPYIVAELLEGEQLGDFLDRSGKLGTSVVIPIVRQVCRALSRAHEQGIVHRDVKPENVFLLGGEHGGVKVLDFGISKLSTQESNLTKTGMVMGTPDYMAPEQARGDRVDARADVYAVGAILYRALTGRKPFEGLDPMATLTAALVQEPPRPSSLEPSIPIELELVMQHAMAKEPRERFQTMAELDSALAAFDPERAVLPVLANAKATVDVSGKTVVSQPGISKPTVAVERGANSARLARPALLFFTGLGFLWLVVNVVVAVGAFIRQLRGADLTASETVLLPVGAVGAAITPVIVWIRYLTREVWPSTPRAVEMGGRLRGTVLYSASAYGIGALFVSLFEVLLQRNGAGVARPGWALMTFLVALTVAVASWVVTRKRR